MIELFRVLREGGFYWCEYGLFQLNKNKISFTRIINPKSTEKPIYDPQQDEALIFINKYLKSAIDSQAS